MSALKLNSSDIIKKINFLRNKSKYNYYLYINLKDLYNNENTLIYNNFNGLDDDILELIETVTESDNSISCSFSQYYLRFNWR